MGQGRSKDRTGQQKEAKDWKFYHAEICTSAGNARTPDAYLGKMERNSISSDERQRDSEADDRYGEYIKKQKKGQ